MNRIVSKAVMTVLLVSFEGIAAEPEEPTRPQPSGPALTVRIYDYARLPEAMLRRAGEKARRIYRAAGIETVWMLCRVSLDEPVKNPACEREPGATVLQMKILPEVMAERFGLEDEVFGFALPPRDGGGFGNVASIFHDRVEKLAEMSGTPGEVILGHMLAHEAGHLLLGVSSHSSKGIMHVPWRVEDLERAELGGLKFTRKQAARMRKQVAARSEADGLTKLMPPAGPSLTVRLYNHAGAPAELLREASSVALNLFEGVGISTRWVRCGAPHHQPDHSTCADAPDARVLRVNVLSRKMAERMGADPGAFGIAFPSERGFGFVAAVFYHRVTELERDLGVKAPLVLGHVLAHEIGHLLLGFRSHTQHGIMSAVWGETAMAEMQQGSFGFSEPRALRMRKQANARAAYSGE